MGRQERVKLLYEKFETLHFRTKRIIEGKLQYAGHLASCFFSSVVEDGHVIGSLIVSWFAFAGYHCT